MLLLLPRLLVVPVGENRVATSFEVAWTFWAEAVENDGTTAGIGGGGALGVAKPNDVVCASSVDGWLIPVEAVAGINSDGLLASESGCPRASDPGFGCTACFR